MCIEHHSRHHHPGPHSHANPFPPRIHRADLHIHYHRQGLTMSRVQLSFTDPIARVDGTALNSSEIASIDIFDSAAADPSTPIGSVTGAGVSFITDTLSVGDHVFTAVVRDTTGHSSAQSNPAAITVPATLANPNAITDLAAELID